ncbi:hypothetical protein ACLMJK_002537 [Lecanora helva]
MDDKSVPETVDTVIVGNGPSALILSFILHGNIPYYNLSQPHPDPILHRKLSQSPCLLNADVGDLTAHFAASRLSYSTQALPINVFLDTLIRPLHDTNPGKYQSCVEWRYEEDSAVSHVVLGDTLQPGGQWADNPVSASWDIGALSYAEMLSLPGFTFGDYTRKHYGKDLPDFYRPSRREVASYFAAYPIEVGIEKAVHTNAKVGHISRGFQGFRIDSHDLNCAHLVLASGVFSNLIPPRPLLQPLSELHSPKHSTEAPLLVVGSGFTAADVIISTPPGRKILHIFKWDPEEHPSPLRACHAAAYPEYASIYRQMKVSAQSLLRKSSVISPLRIKKSNPFFQDRDWDHVYEGLPNTYIKHIIMKEKTAILTLETGDQRKLEREVSCMDYVIGRRGSLNYLSHEIGSEIGLVEDDIPVDLSPISGKSLRSRVEKNFQIASNVFAIGSLTGDSLIRFAFGSCVFAAGTILQSSISANASTEHSPSSSTGDSSTAPSSPMEPPAEVSDVAVCDGGHNDLHYHKHFHSLCNE